MAAAAFLCAIFQLAARAQEEPVWEVWALHQILPESPEGKIEFDLAANTAQGTNGICIRYGTAVLTADTATVNRDTGEAVADGRVRIEQGDQLWVGDHIRPRVRAPESWHLPVGLSLSAEVGYQRAKYSPDTWSLELRPIIDKQLGKWYMSFNPTLDRSFHGPGVASGMVFSPNFKAGYDVTKKVNVGFEYYGSLGPVTGFDPIREQQQQLIPSVDLNLSENWEFNAGLGVGVTGSTDHLILKFIVGRRFDFGRRKKPEVPAPGVVPAEKH